MRKIGSIRTLAITTFVCLAHCSVSFGQESPFVFEEVGAAWGIADHLRGIMAHAAACGDFDADGDLDLYVGNFSDRRPEQYTQTDGPVPNVLLVQEGGKFQNSGQEVLAVAARSSGAAFADLDNDGDLDLYLSNNSKHKGMRVANSLFENVSGAFRDVSTDNAVCIVMGGRSVGVLDFDGDGLLDLLVAEDWWAGSRTRLFRNQGGLKFEDATTRAGLPEELPGLGVIAPDLNLDGWPDLFVAQANRLFLSRGDGTYAEGDATAFRHTPLNGEDSPCGVACGDLDRDGDLDIVIVNHAQPARQHLFENLGLHEGKPRFREVTAEAGLAYLFPKWTPEGNHLKHAHVEIADFDNDGSPDILVAGTYLDAGSSTPFICRNLGAEGQRMRFHLPPITKANAYYAAGPVADYDRDGRMDAFFASWLPEKPSKLYLNRTSSSHWLEVQIVGKSINRMGIGSRVSVYSAGHSGDPEALLGYGEIGMGYGFCTGQEAVAHFGLGAVETCDVEVQLPFGRGHIRARNLRADSRVLLEESEEPREAR